MRRSLFATLATLIAVVAVGSLVVGADSGSSSVTGARLERSLTSSFANLYADKARLQGRTGVTPASLDPQAMCDKAGPINLDLGPGGDWVCLMSWADPDVPMPAEGYGKFELNVHSNDCYTASSPSKLTGFRTLADTSGAEVINPVFEFDACFDPSSDNTATGVVFPSLLAVTSTVVAPAADGRAGVSLTCGTGERGCVGEIQVTSGRRALGTIEVDLDEESSVTLALPQAVPEDAGDLTLTARISPGFGPTSPITLPVQGR